MSNKFPESEITHPVFQAIVRDARSNDPDDSKRALKEAIIKMALLTSDNKYRIIINTLAKCETGQDWLDFIFLYKFSSLEVSPEDFGHWNVVITTIAGGLNHLSFGPKFVQEVIEKEIRKSRPVTKNLRTQKRKMRLT